MDDGPTYGFVDDGLTPGLLLLRLVPGLVPLAIVCINVGCLETVLVMEGEI